MRLAAALRETAVHQTEAHFETFARTLDPGWIQQALERTGTASIRRRKLPADRVIWLVLGMGLLRDRSIRAVCDHLHLVLPPPHLSASRIESSSLVEARDRLGACPLQTLFELLAEHEAGRPLPEESWRGLHLFGMDGSTFTVPDSEENRTAFDGPSSGARGDGAYPQLRVVALMHLGSHRLRHVRIGSYRQGELTLADELLPLLPAESLLLMDRGYACWSRLYQHGQRPERHWLLRGKKNLKWRVTRTQGPGDALVDITFTAVARKAWPDLPTIMPARVIAYQRPGHPPQYLVTSLLDAQQYPAAELVELYHVRWEIELGLDELKTHTLDREEALRSRTPERVRQELYGLLVVYNLVRSEMTRIAQTLEVTPLRVSYRLSLLLMRNFWLSAWVVAAGRVPQHLEQLAADLQLLLLPERRPRSNPRVVKVKMSSYLKKPRPSRA